MTEYEYKHTTKRAMSEEIDRQRDQIKELYRASEPFGNTFWHTAWQWLAIYHRIPRVNAETEAEHYDCGTYHYYHLADTNWASDKEYEALKALYIEKYGGWDTIDLDHTTYNGKVWWRWECKEQPDGSYERYPVDKDKQ